MSQPDRAAPVSVRPVGPVRPVRLYGLYGLYGSTCMSFGLPNTAPCPFRLHARPRPCFNTTTNSPALRGYFPPRCYTAPWSWRCIRRSCAAATVPIIYLPWATPSPHASPLHSSRRARRPASGWFPASVSLHWPCFPVCLSYTSFISPLAGRPCSPPQCGNTAQSSAVALASRAA